MLTVLAGGGESSKRDGTVKTMLNTLESFCGLGLLFLRMTDLEIDMF